MCLWCANYQMTLYKYVTAERIDVLQNGLIRFTQASALNDPWDMRPHVERLITENDLVTKPDRERSTYSQFLRRVKDISGAQHLLSIRSTRGFSTARSQH